MKILQNKLDLEDLEVEEFGKIRLKKDKLKGKQTVNQLVRDSHPDDPETRFNSSDLNDLVREGYLDDLIAVIKTGKEASVYLGRGPSGLVAVKVYTDLRVRSFKRDQSYREGRFIGDARIERALEHGSKFGHEVRQALWVQEEFRQMQHLAEHGVRVPKAVAVSGISLIMEFIGDVHGNPAPRLSDIRLGQEEAQEALVQSVRSLKLMVASGRVHGDYSAFNILWQDGEAVVIDFPQVIEIKHHRDARAFLERDVRSLCRSFQKQGVFADEARILREVRASWPAL